MKPILDVCCGGRMFYVDKENPNVLFCDKRFFETTFKKVGKDEKFSVKPDRIVDFRDLPFENESFYLVIFDPPHILRGSQKSFMVQKYGKLDKSYRKDSLILQPIYCFDRISLFTPYKTHKSVRFWKSFA
ncbi:hypothetical protein [Helicobacter sp. UBA3407]|uniref:hypothetical protein n=1 Tax=Helicobacter sp. UBA3407 TaxID=1946588 RepID=UPI00261E5B32|nr:hypothetical protein [Helicobacter sp. UBA3407]